MKTKTLVLSLFVILNLTASTLFAAIVSNRVTEAARELDDIVKKMDIKSIAPNAARLFKLETALIEKVMIERKATLSALVCAKLISEKTGVSIDKVIEANPDRDWSKALKNAEIADSAILEEIDTVHAEFAFFALEFREKRRK